MVAASFCQVSLEFSTKKITSGKSVSYNLDWFSFAKFLADTIKLFDDQKYLENILSKVSIAIIWITVSLGLSIKFVNQY